MCWNISFYFLAFEILSFSGIKGEVIKKIIIFLHNSVQIFLTVTMLKYFSLVYNEIHSMFTIISLAVFFPVIFWLDKTCYPIVSQRGIMAQFPTFFHSFKWFDWNFCKTWRTAWLNINYWAQNSFFESIRYWFTCFGQ